MPGCTMYAYLVGNDIYIHEGSMSRRFVMSQEKSRAAAAAAAVFFSFFLSFSCPLLRATCVAFLAAAEASTVGMITTVSRGWHSNQDPSYTRKPTCYIVSTKPFGS